MTHHLSMKAICLAACLALAAAPAFAEDASKSTDPAFQVPQVANPIPAEAIKGLTIVEKDGRWLVSDAALQPYGILRADETKGTYWLRLPKDKDGQKLGDADIVRAEGRMFPVETVYLGDLPMSAAISKALKETEGDILCFLPGESEIRRVRESCASLTSGKDSASPLFLPLYGSLPKEEQDKVFSAVQPSTFSLQPAPRKVVLATSIAETSVTIEGITCVIDSGLMRVPRFSPSTGMSGLVTLPLT